MGVSDVDVAPIFGGGAGGTAASSSENCESGFQLSIPSRQPRSVGAKRPVRRPSRTSSSENTPKLVAPRLTWIIAIIRRFSQKRRIGQVKCAFGPELDGRRVTTPIQRLFNEKLLDYSDPSKRTGSEQQ